MVFVVRFFTKYFCTGNLNKRNMIYGPFICALNRLCVYLELSARVDSVASVPYVDYCLGWDWLAAGPLIDDEVKRQVVLIRISVEEFLYDLVECLDVQPDEDELVLGDAATPDPDRA
jgi:hypothetical protein